MDDWDQDKLDEVVRQKHGTEKNRPTDIICKFFLDAVEKKTYGWWGLLLPGHLLQVDETCLLIHPGMFSICRFWQCPNGKECKYRHALPPGYVLKSQMKVLLHNDSPLLHLCSRKACRGPLQGNLSAVAKQAEC